MHNSFFKIYLLWILDIFTLLDVYHMFAAFSSGEKLGSKSNAVTL